MKIYRTIILPVVLYGCEIWSLKLREERRLSVFVNRVLWIFGPKDEVTGEWRRLHNEERYDLYSSKILFRLSNQEEIGRACGTYGKKERCILGFGGEIRGKETTLKT